MRVAPSLRLFIVFVVLTLAAAACSGDDGSDPSAGDDAGDGGDSGDGDEGDDSGDSGDSASSGDDATGNDDGGSVIDTPGDYCTLQTEQQALADAFNPLGDSESVEEFYSRLPDLLDQAILLVPEDLKEDFAAVRFATVQAVALLEQSDWNFIAVSSQLQSLYETPEVVAATERIEAYELEFCSTEVDDDASTDDGSTDGGEGTASGGDDDGSTEGGSTGGGEGTAAGGGDDEFANPFGDLGFPVEVLEGMLASEFGREAYAQALAESNDLTVEEATCLLDNLEVGVLLAMAGDGPDGEAMEAVVEDAYDACGVDASSIIG